MTPLLRELLERATERGYLAPERPRDARLLSVIEDELGDLVAAHPARSLVLPRTARMRCAAEHLIDQLDDAPSLRAIAGATGMSLRSFERNFAHETGLSPREWLRHARLSAASLALAAGASVTDAGLAAGYSSLSAFIAAYRSVYGTTPGRHGGRRTPQHLHREAFTAALFSW
jgi:AraC-like DNA-binding protein